MNLVRIKSLIYFIFVVGSISFNSLTILGQTSYSDSLTTKIEISANIEETQVPLNRTTRLFVTLSWIGDADRYSITNFDNPALTNFDIVGTSTVNRSEVIDSQPHVFKDYTYTLQPRDLGMGYVEGVIVKCRDMVLERDENLVTQRISIEITDPIPDPTSSTPMWTYAVIFVVIAGLAVIFFLWLKKRREAKEELDVAPPPPIEELYLDMLRLEIRLEVPNLTEDFSSLSKLVRRYLTERFHIKALEDTTEKLLEELKVTELEEHQANSIKEILTRCDEIKFSAIEGTPEELNRFYTLFEGILQFFLQRKEVIESENEENKKEK